MSELKVLLVTNTLGKWAEANGVEYTYNNLLPFFEQKDIPTDVLTYGPRDTQERRGSVTIFTHRPRLPVRIDPALKVDGLLRFTGLARRVLSSKYDVVHSATPDTLGYLGARAAAGSDCPLVNVYHTVLDYYARVRVGKMLGPRMGRAAGRLMAGFLSHYYNKSDLILAPSAFTRQDVASLFKPRAEVLERGINPEIFSPRFRTRRDTGVQALYVGRVAPEKNLGLLVELFRSRPATRLKVVGDGPYLKEMQRLLPGALYTGQLTGEPLSKAFADADFFVFPSRSDSFGNVVLQALCSGIPAIVTDSMGPKEQISHGTTGYVADSDDMFGHWIDKLAGDAPLRQRMGLAARADAEKYSWECVFGKLLDYYELAREIHRGSGAGR